MSYSLGGWDDKLALQILVEHSVVFHSYPFLSGKIFSQKFQVYNPYQFCSIFDLFSVMLSSVHLRIEIAYFTAIGVLSMQVSGVYMYT